ncbi:MAG: Disulfide bond formation protein DsbA [Hyphomicrobiales bacterium]|jgi:protein-disulfide isomerase|nr:Disulfide bond formation protein DsbA [Hyphomicrobiales bacterium]
MPMQSTKTRRQMLELMAVAGFVAAGGASLGMLLPTPAAAQGSPAVPMDQLLVEGALPDIWLGSKDAPVTIIEYASMTCSHCATFHNETFPTLKSKYIDTGKVRFTLREFPFDPLATAGFMLARCAGPDKREAMVDLLFAQQKNWAFTDKPLEGLSNLVKQTGMSQQAFEACLKDKALYDNINQTRDRAAEKFKVDSTPTFFINGRKQSGAMTISQLEKAIDPLLKS